MMTVGKEVTTAASETLTTATTSRMQGRAGGLTAVTLQITSQRISISSF